MWHPEGHFLTYRIRGAGLSRRRARRGRRRRRRRARRSSGCCAPHTHGTPHRAMLIRSACVAAALAASAQAGDPSPGWLTYAQWTSPAGGRITKLNTTWVVPSNPSDMAAGDSGAPGWWFGIQNTKGDGALIQPILAWGYLGPMYTMFNGVFDWTDVSWHTSDEKFTVKPGDKLVSSIYFTGDNSYTMLITSTATGKSISTPYKLEAKQTTKETTAYFVLEHTPRKCAALSAAGQMSFENIYLEVEGQQVKKPHWQPVKGARKCNAATVISDPATIKITWDTTGDGIPQNSTSPVRPQPIFFTARDRMLMPTSSTASSRKGRVVRDDNNFNVSCCWNRLMAQSGGRHPRNFSIDKSDYSLTIVPPCSSAPLIPPTDHPQIH
eukprot:COSAG02_NODE_7657_length_2908_cov_52.017958_2_plen_381_part_00